MSNARINVDRLRSILSSGNLTLTDPSVRIIGDLTSSTISTRLLFQTSASNSISSVGVIPTGTATSSFYTAYNNNTGSNASVSEFGITTAAVRVNSATTGTGTVLPIVFAFSGSEVARFSTSGNLGIGSTNPTTALDVWRSGGTTTIRSYQSDTGATSYAQILAQKQGGATAEIIVDASSGYVGTTTNNPLILRTNLTPRLEISANGNINISTIGARITGDFSNSTLVNRVALQTNVANSNTSIAAVPNGTASQALFRVHNSADPTNAADAQLLVNSSEASVRSAVTGTGTYLPLTFYTNGTEKLRIGADTTGSYTFSGTTPRIIADFSNATHTSRMLFQSSTTNGNTIVGVIPNGTSSIAQLNLYANSDPTNTSIFQALTGSGEISVRSSITGTGAYLPLTVYTNGTEKLRIGADATGSYTFSGTAPRIRGDFTNAATSSRLSFQTNTNNGATVITALPNGTATDSGFIATNATDSANASIATIGATSTKVIVGSTRTGSGTFLPLVLQTSGTDAVTITTAGNVGVGTDPAYKFDVYGGILDIPIDSQIIAQRLRVATTNADSLEFSKLRDGSSSDWTTSGWRLQQKVDSTWMGYIQLNGINNQNGISFGTGASTVSPRSVAERLRIDSTGNVNISTVGARITADFSNATPANRVQFQSSISNGVTNLGLLPNGSATESRITASNNSDSGNASVAYLAALSNRVVLASDRTGAGTFQSLVFQTSGSDQLTLDTSGNATFGGTGAIKLHAGTTAERPSPVTGMIRYNTSTANIEGYVGAAWINLSGGGGGGSGTVTSVGASGGTTGLSFTGSPITSSGTLTLGGTLATANGGTGLSSFTTNRVFYASSSTVVAQSAGLTFDGTTFATTGAANFATSSGNVGIGTTSPSGKLQVVAGNTRVRFSNTAGTASTLLFGADSGEMFLGAETNAPVYFITNNTERMRIGASGALGFNGANYGTSGQVLSSNGASAVPSWQTLSSANATFLQSGANAQSRTVQSKLRDVYSFQDFGAVGDGIVDDTVAMQFAIDAVAAAGAGTLLSKNKALYKITAPLIIKSGVKIDLCGSTIAQYTNNVPIITAPSATMIVDWVLRNGLLTFNTLQDGLASVQVNITGSISVGDRMIGLTSGITGIVRSVVGSTINYIGTGLFSSGENLLILGVVQGTTTSVGTSMRQGVGLRLADGSFSYQFVVEDLTVSNAYDGIMCPNTAGSFAFVGQIQNYTGVDCSRWSMNIDCYTPVGANTNLVLTNCWAIPSTPGYNQITAKNVTGSFSVGNIIVGSISGASGRVTAVSGTGSNRSLTFDLISAINFSKDENITVNGVIQGQVDNPNTQPFSSGFRFDGASQFQWQSLFADKIRGQFLFAQSSSGWFGVLSHEASVVEAQPNFEASSLQFSNVNATIASVKFIGVDFKTYNLITVDVTGNVAIGDTITATNNVGTSTGATGIVTQVNGAGASKIIVFHSTSVTNFAVGNQVRVGGVSQGTVTNASLNNGNLYMVRHTAGAQGQEFVIDNEIFVSTNECTYTGTNIYEVSCTADSAGPPAAGAAWYYNLRAETARVGGFQLADFAATKQIRLWNGENRYYTLGMTADAAWDGNKTNMQFAAMNVANSTPGYSPVNTDRQLRIKSTGYGFNRDGGITLYSSDGTNDQYITKALRLRTNGGGVPRLAIVGPNNTSATIEINTSDNVGAEQNRVLIASDGNVSFGGTGATKLHSGTTAERPGSPTAGMIRHNTTSSNIECYVSGGWTNITGAVGTVTSVSASGGTTGLSFTGSPITGSGTLTLGGTLAIANGGTGATTVAAARTNLGLGTGDSPQFTDIYAVRGAALTTGVIYLGNTGTRYVYFNGTNYEMPNGQLDVNSQRVLNAGNYNSYAPTLTGGGASGTNWAISITGNAATASSVAWTNVSSRPTAVSSFTNDSGYITSSGTAANVSGIVAIANGGTGATTDANARTNLDVPQRNGTGASGNWGINITGNAATASNLSNWTSLNFTYVPGSPYWLVGSDTIGNGRVYEAAQVIAALAVPKSGGTFTGAIVVQGSVTATSYITSSDERLKSDWISVQPGFVEALAKNVKSGTYIKVGSKKREAGITAQSIQTILPEVVSLDAEQDTLYLEYGQAAMVSAVELAKEVVTLKEELHALKTLLNRILEEK